jgi:hypothetical protein
MVLSYCDFFDATSGIDLILGGLTWRQGDVEAYVAFLSYHLPYAYTAQQRAEYDKYPAAKAMAMPCSCGESGRIKISVA